MEMKQLKQKEKEKKNSIIFLDGLWNTVAMSALSERCKKAWNSAVQEPNLSP